MCIYISQVICYFYLSLIFFVITISFLNGEKKGIFLNFVWYKKKRLSLSSFEMKFDSLCLMRNLNEIEEEGANRKRTFHKYIERNNKLWLYIFGRKFY